MRICSHNAMLLVLAERIQNWQVLLWQVILMLDGVGSKRNKMGQLLMCAKKDQEIKYYQDATIEWDTKGYYNQFNSYTS